MRIFYAAMRSPNLLQLGASTVWERNLYAPLRKLGHDVVQFSGDMSGLLCHADIRRAEDRHYVEAHRPDAEARLLREVVAAHRERRVDLFFSYFYSACVTSDTIRAIRDLGICTVNFFCNNVHQFDLVADIAPAYDFCMVPEKVALRKYEAAGARPVHIQMAADPDMYRPHPLARDYQVTFVGQRYGERPSLVDHLLRHGVQVRVFGPGWAPSAGPAPGSPASRRGAREQIARLHPARVARALVRRAGLSPRERRLRRAAGPSLSDDEMIRLYSRSHASLGFSTVNEVVAAGAPDSHLRLRDFEAPMCGALYITGYTEELEDCFDLDREVVAYRSRDELLEKVRYYLRHPGDAEAIRQAARRRSVADHTWTARFTQLFDHIYGNASCRPS